MADLIQIQCMHKSDRQNPHERILSIEGFHNGQRWKLTQEQAIAGIDRGKWSFFVSVAGRTVTVSRFGNRYLKTEADGEQPNNLLSLPECP